MRTDVKIGLVCAFVIVMGAVIYFVAQPAHPAKPHNSDAQAASSGTTPEPSTAPSTAPGLASGSVGGPFILPPGPGDSGAGPMAGAPSSATPEAAGSLTSGTPIPPFGAPSMNGQFASGTLGSPSPSTGFATGPTGANGASASSSGTLGSASSFGPSGPTASAGQGAHGGTIDLSGTTPFTGLGAGMGAGTPSAATTYVIQKDDMLGPIAKRFGVSVSAILAANPGLNANRLQINKPINIPAGGSGTAVASGTTPPTTAPSARGSHDSAAHAATHTVAAATSGAAKPGASYKVRKSDTLMTISRAAYGTEKDWKRIYKANEKEISDPNLVPVGLVLKIPQ